MKSDQVQRANIQDLLEAYKDAAAAHCMATERGDQNTANRSHDVLVGIHTELRRRGAEALNELLNLLQNKDTGVRFWAASHALEFSPEKGENVLSEIAKIPKSLIAFSAEVTLREWRAGRLRFP